MRFLAVLLPLLLLAAAAQLAEAKFTQRLTVQVFDQQFRPVEGAEAYVDYQLNSVSGYIKTKPVLTGENGLAQLVFTNYEEIEDSTEYSATLYVKYGGQLSATGFVANNSARTLSASVLSSVLLVHVRDQQGKALPALVTVGAKTKETDAGGNAIFQIPPGNYTVKAELNGVVRSRLVPDLNADRVVDIEIGIYSLLVRVSDDYGKPLDAEVELEGQIVRTGADGTAAFFNISSESPQVIVRHNESFRRYTPNLGGQAKLDVTFDLANPVIKELHASVSVGGVGTISIYSEDPGAGASGIDTVSVSYNVGGAEETVPAYSVGYNSFEARIPAQSPRTLVSYMVRITDREGNTGFGSGTYLVPEEESGGGAPVPKGGFDLGNLTPEAIIISLAVISLFAYGIFYYLTKRNRAA